MRKLKQYLKLLGIVLVVLVMLIGVGYYFAQQKSEPVYLSKIDKIMFDNHNKAPQFILTLPDFDKRKANVVQEEPIAETVADAAKAITMADILGGIPNLSKLKVYEPTQTLKHIGLDDDLVDDNQSNLLLPQIANDGSKPWFEYGKMVKVAPNFRRVAIVIKNVGFDDAAVDFVNKDFPSEISIALTPYGQNLGTKILDLRRRGHETYVDLLLSSRDFLRSDSGPLAMSLTISAEESIKRLLQTLAVGAPLGGVVINDGIADESNAEILTKLLEELKNRGLLLVDATSEMNISNLKVPGLARRKADVVIEKNYNIEHIRNKLLLTETLAMKNGQVVLVIEPKPIILQAVNQWLQTFSPQVSYEESKNMEITKPLALVPISNLVVE